MSAATTFASADGDGYELQMGRWSRRLAPLFIDFAGTQGRVRVLDVGCGTGSLSLCLVEDPDIISVRGLDISAPYIGIANARRCDDRLQFRVADACALPFADDSFDHALSLLAVQFVPQAERAVREMRRVTRSGGTVAAATWDSRGGFVAHRMFYDTAAVVDASGVAARARACARPMSRREDLMRVWLEVGLLDVEVTALTIRMEFTSFDDYWTPMEGREGPVAEYVRSLAVEAKRQLREMVKLAYLDGETDGARSYAATAWAVKGRV